MTIQKFSVFGTTVPKKQVPRFPAQTNHRLLHLVQRQGKRKITAASSNN
jgi:hypothetical protein